MGGEPTTLVVKGPTLSVAKPPDGAVVAAQVAAVVGGWALSDSTSLAQPQVSTIKVKTKTFFMPVRRAEPRPGSNSSGPQLTTATNLPPLDNGPRQDHDACNGAASQPGFPSRAKRRQI